MQAKNLWDMITFTRAGTARFVDANGFLQVAAIDVPRFDYSTGRRGLLLEGPGTNLLPRSSKQETSFWTKYRCTVAESDTPAPDNETFLRAVDYTGEPTWPVITQVPSFNNGDYALSAFFKPSGMRYANLGVDSRLWFDLENGVVADDPDGIFVSALPLAGGVWRITITETLPSGVNQLFLGFSDNPSIAIIDTTPRRAGFIWGAQLETGSYPTSYIPTDGATVTRPADNAQLAEPVAALLRSGEATVLLQAAGIPVPPSNTPGAKLLSGPENSDHLLLARGGAILVGPGSLRSFYSGIASPTPSFAVTLGWSADETRGACSENGALVDLGAGLNAGNFSTVYLGRNAAGNFANGWYYQLVVWPFRMTDADLQAKGVSYD